jgi:hypothetical protein
MYFRELALNVFPPRNNVLLFLPPVLRLFVSPQASRDSAHCAIHLTNTVSDVCMDLLA